jgi:transposase
MAMRKVFTGEQWRTIKHAKTKNANAKVRLQALKKRGEGKTNREIAEILDIHPQYVTVLVRKFIEQGIESILETKHTSNNRRMTFDEESEFLRGFDELAKIGQIITVTGILKKFEEVTGKESNTTTIYQLLKRHGWRKIMPRPEHPGKATDEEIDSSKKLKQFTRVYWQNTVIQEK